MMSSGDKAVRKRTARKDDGKASSKKKLLEPQVSHVEQDDPYEFRGTQSLQHALNTTPTRIVFMQSPQTPQLQVSTGRKSRKQKKAPAERQQEKLWKLEEYDLQRAIEESKKQLQAEERKRRIHRRDDSGPSGLASTRELGNHGSAALKTKNKLIKTKLLKKANKQEKEVLGKKGSPSFSNEDIKLDETSCNDDATVLGQSGGESPSVLDNMLGVPIPSHSPEEQQDATRSVDPSVSHTEGGESACTTTVGSRLSEKVEDQGHKGSPISTQRLDFDECADAMHDNQLLNTQHSPTDVPGGTMSSPSTPNMKIAMDISTQELSHPPSPSPSHPTPTTSPQQSPPHAASCLSKNTRLILKALDTCSATLRAAQENSIQRVPWGKPVRSVHGQPWDSLEIRRTVRQSRRNLAREKNSLLELSGVVAVRQEDEVDEFMAATETSPSALHNTPRHTSQNTNSRHTPQNANSRHTPQNTNSRHTPQNANSRHTPQNANSRHTPQNANSRHTPQNANSSRNIVNSGHTPQTVENKQHTLVTQTVDQSINSRHTSQTAQHSLVDGANGSQQHTPVDGSKHIDQDATPLSRGTTSIRTLLMNKPADKGSQQGKKLSLSLRKMTSMNTSLRSSNAGSHRELFNSSSQDLSKEHIQMDEEMDIENENNEENEPKVQKRGRNEDEEEEKVLRSESSCEAEDEPEEEEVAHNGKPLNSARSSQQSSVCNSDRAFERIPQVRIPRIRHKKIRKIDSSEEEENELEEETVEQRNAKQSPEKIVEIDLTSEPSSPCAVSEGLSSTARIMSSQEQRGESPCGTSINPPMPQSSHKTPRHKQFVQKVFQEDDDEVEDFSNSSGSSSDAWPTLSAIQRPRKRRRTEKVSNRRKHDDSEDDLVLLEDSESQSHSTELLSQPLTREQQPLTREQDKAEEYDDDNDDDERETTPQLNGVPFMTTDGGYDVDPTAISSSPIRSYQQISSLNERSNFDYSNQFATSAKKKQTTATTSNKGKTSRKPQNTSRKKHFFGGRMRGRGRGGRRSRGKR